MVLRTIDSDQAIQMGHTTTLQVYNTTVKSDYHIAWGTITQTIDL